MLVKKYSKQQTSTGGQPIFRGFGLRVWAGGCLPLFRPGAKIARYRNTGIPKSDGPDIQEFRNTMIPKFRNIGITKRQNPMARGFQISGISESLNSRSPGFWTLGARNFARTPRDGSAAVRDDVGFAATVPP